MNKNPLRSVGCDKHRHLGTLRCRQEGASTPSTRCWPRASAAKFSGEQRSELQDPSPHRFVGHMEPTLGGQILDVAIAERETHMEANGVPKDRGRKLVAGKRD